MKNAHLQLGDKVICPSIYENEIFEVVGFTKTEILLNGDWSGGTHPQSGCDGWVSRDIEFILQSEIDLMIEKILNHWFVLLHRIQWDVLYLKHQTFEQLQQLYNCLPKKEN